MALSMRAARGRGAAATPPLLLLLSLMAVVACRMTPVSAFSGDGSTASAQLRADSSSSSSSGAGSMAPEFPLAVFNVEDLEQAAHSPRNDPSSVTLLQALRDAVFNVGMLALDVSPPSSPSPASPALLPLVRCSRGGRLADSLRSVQLQDGSSRSTLATATNHSLPQPLPLALHTRCPAFTRPATKLRRVVDQAGLAYGAALDKLVHGSVGGGVDGSVDSYLEAVARGESLEHFHMFSRPMQAKGDRGEGAQGGEGEGEGEGVAALEMHSDVGLFIVMTAAEYFPPSDDQGEGEGGQGALGEGRETGSAPLPQHPGLYLELPGGRVVRPTFPPGSLLVMNGEAAGRWMRAREGSALPPAAPHEVVLPRDMGGLVRAWYGRMFFPLSSAVLRHPTPSPLTFGEYRAQTMSALSSGQPHLASSVGCPSTRRLLQDQGACPAGQLYCWMQCMPIPSDLTCSKEVMQCKNPANQLWPTDFPLGAESHCEDCQPVCPGQNVTISSDGFCNTRLTAVSMWMTGFQFTSPSTSPSGPCVVYLFPEWSLNSKVKFAFACIGTFLMGMATAALGHARNMLMRSRLAIGSASASSPGGAGAKYLGPAAGKVPSDRAAAVGVPANGGHAGARWRNASRGMRRGLHLAGETGLYAVQMTLAYFLMLLAMTYQAELFLMVVLGLSAGHGLLLYLQDEEVHEVQSIQLVQATIANPEPCCSCA